MIAGCFVLTTFLMGPEVDASSTIEGRKANTGVVEERPKIKICDLFKNKFFVLGLMSAFFNLILYVLLEPILSDRLTKIGVEEKNLGKYFFIMPFTYAAVSLLIDHFLLKRMHKRICLIVGFVIFFFGFLITGPSRIFDMIVEPNIHIMMFGLVILGIGCSLSFVPIFSELIDSVKDQY